MRHTPEQIHELKENEVFVFGSNEAGIHGAGAAYLAELKYGAVRGCGYGHFGKSFAIPTKDKGIRTLSLIRIKKYVDCFIYYAMHHPEVTFLVTKIGCGLAGYTPEDIAPLFREARGVNNIILPIEFS